MKLRDIIAGLIIGEASALLILIIFKNLKIEVIPIWSLAIILPVLSLVGLQIAFLLARKFIILWQFAKFGLVGVLNTLIDLGVLNLLIFFSGITSGLGYSVFKGISFVVAVVNSYFWNKYWTFEKGGEVKTGEFLQFFIVAGLGFAINVGTASLIVNIIGPQFGLSDKIWANIGAIIATLAGMIWNFLGYKFIVFKK